MASSAISLHSTTSLLSACSRPSSSSSSSSAKNPQCSSSRKTNPKVKLKPRLNSKQKPATSSPLPPLRSRPAGGDATTWTVLPPRDEISNPNFNFPAEIKLSELEALSSSSLSNSSAVSNKKERGKVKKLSDERHLPKELVLGNDDDDDDDEELSESEFNSDVFNDNENEEEDIGFGIEAMDHQGDDFFEEDEVQEGKDKGVPAVMRCFDRAKIYVKAGDGGKGAVAFRREKFIPFGGPSGGDGGKGGNVYLEVDGSMNSLLPFRKAVHFRAGEGGNGLGRKMNGAKGDDIVVRIAPGTVIREAVNSEEGREGGEVLLEMMKPGQRALLLPGGRGGRGNASFKTGTNKVPKIAEKGEEGAEMWLNLELKLVADVGIVGAPNAGKSTLLSAVTAAEPAIASYPFTTLLPNLGVVSLDYDATIVIADLPGLLEGAHLGFGLGHEFLRHSERCSVLVHVVDGSSEQPLYEFDAIRLELELFSPDLAEKPFIVAFNKMDLPEVADKWTTFEQELSTRGIRPFSISAISRQGTNEVILAANEVLQKFKKSSSEFEDPHDTLDLNHVADAITRQRSASLSDFQVFYDSSSKTWHVSGSGLQRFIQMTNWQYNESVRRFQHVLEACGVNRALTKQGVKEGDTVIVCEMELVWHDDGSKFGS